jgi:hypothetical protein
MNQLHHSYLLCCPMAERSNFAASTCSKSQPHLPVHEPAPEGSAEHDVLIRYLKSLFIRGAEVRPTVLCMGVVPVDTSNSPEICNSFELRCWRMGMAGFNPLEHWRYETPWCYGQSKVEVRVNQTPRMIYMRGTILTDHPNSGRVAFHVKCEVKLDLQRLVRVCSPGIRFPFFYPCPLQITGSLADNRFPC